MAEDRLDQLDYYTLLGVSDKANSDQIREAFHAFALRFHPDRHVGSMDDKVGRASQIYRRGAEAYRILLNSETRKRYDAGLAEGRLKYDPNEEPTRVPGRGTVTGKTVGAKAAPFFQKAKAARQKGDLQGAKLNLGIAIGHEPDNAALKAELAELTAMESQIKATKKK